MKSMTSRLAIIAVLLSLQLSQAVLLGNSTQIAVNQQSTSKTNLISSSTAKNVSSNTTAHSLATQGQKSGQKTMLQLWDKVRADSLQGKLDEVEAKITSCFTAASSNTSMAANYNTSRNATADQKDSPKQATMCKAEKQGLRALHVEVAKELAEYIDLIKESTDTFSQQAIEKNGLKHEQMEPFSEAGKLVQSLQKAERRHLVQVIDEPVFDKLSEQMSTVLEWYEKYMKESNQKAQDE